jgi:hypothetical protein
MINRFSVALLVSATFATILGAADTTLWEPGKVIAVEQVSTPAKEPDPSCRAVPKGATPPPQCRPSNLRAEQFWRVTVEAGNKRFVVRPYRAQSVLASLNQSATEYVDPKLTTGSVVEVAVVSSKVVRLRTDQGQGIPAVVDSQELLSKPPAPPVTSAQPQSAQPQKFWAAISVSQPVFQLKEAGTLQLNFAVVNDGDTAANPNVEASHLFINGSEAKDWSFAISNALPPGQALSFAYQLGSRYFAMPGVYAVRWEGQNFRAPEIIFRVMQ